MGVGMDPVSTYHVLYSCSAQLYKILKWLQHAKKLGEGEWSFWRPEANKERTNNSCTVGNQDENINSSY